MVKCKNCLKNKCDCEVCKDFRYPSLISHANEDGYACILCHSCGCENPEEEKG